MREVPRDNQFPNEGVPSDDFAPVLSSGPSETELVIVALLMRIYDTNVEILRALDEDKADAVWELHEQGGHANPPIFIPDVATPDSE